MRRIAVGLAVLFLIFAQINMAVAQTAVPETVAKSAFIVDATTGAVLLNKNADVRTPTASLSKIMSMAVVFKALRDGRLRLTDTLTVSEKAWKMEGSKMFVALGSAVPVEDLIKGVIVQSGNDATVVLAEGVAGSEDKFAGMMNEMAASYGMKDSHFMNASGLPDPNHYSTPHDLGILAYHIINDYPQEHQYYSMREFTWNNITQQNRNPLLGKVQGADGLKTGHTEESGFSLIGTAVRDGRRVVMVLTGMASMKEREAEGIRMMEWALNSFKLARMVTKGQALLSAPVVYGKATSVSLAAGVDAVSTVPATMRTNELTMKARYMSPLVAPIAAGQKVGTLIVSGPGVGTQEYPLVTTAAVEKKGLIGLTFDKIIQAASSK